MSNAVNIPKMWEDSFLKLLEKNLTLGKTAARKFDTVLKKGDTITVPVGFDPTIRDYDGTGTITPEYVSSTAIEIKIDDGKAYHEKMTEADYIQLVNSDDLIKKTVNRCTYKMLDAMEQKVASLYTEATIIGNNNSSVTVTESNAYELLEEMAILYSENYVQEENRFVVLPRRYVGFLNLEIKNTFDTDKAMETFGKGYKGNVSGWNIIVSENVYKSTDATPVYQPLFGIMGSTYALAVQKNVKGREERPNGTMDYAFLGSCLYGAGVHDPQTFGTVPITLSTSLLS